MQTPEARTHESLSVDLSVRQLRAFTTVAETLSYVEAANVLHYTEPGIFAQVKRLEHAIGCRLLVRNGRGLRLTPEGAAILPACRAVVSGAERIESIRNRLAQSARIVVATGAVTGSYLLPAVIRAFTDRRPPFTVELAIGSGREVIDLVARGRADLGIAGTIDRFPMPETLICRHWLEEPHALFAGAAAPRQFVAPAVIYAMSTAVGPLNEVRRRLERAGIGDVEVVARPSIEAVKGACIAGLGYALLPRRAVQLERQSGLMHEVQGFDEGLIGHVWICRRLDGQNSAEAEAFLAFLQEFSVSGSLHPRDAASASRGL